MMACAHEDFAAPARRRMHADPAAEGSSADAAGASLLRAIEGLQLPFVSYCEIALVDAILADAAKAERLLCTSERVTLSRCRCSKRRAEFLAGRVAAKRAAARALRRTDSAKIEIVKTANGAPVLPHHPELRVSISHSARFALAMVSNHPIGIDLEREHQRTQALASWFFHEHELKQLSCKHGEDWHALINLLWTRKEATAKLGHFGGSLEFSHFDCSRPKIQVGPMAIRLKSLRNSGYVFSVAYGEHLGVSHG